MLGSKKDPVVVQVPNEEEVTVILADCVYRGWNAIIVVEPDEPRHVYRYEQLVRREERRAVRRATLQENRRPPMNSACGCGSGRKYKRCCGKR